MGCGVTRSQCMKHEQLIYERAVFVCMHLNSAFWDCLQGTSCSLLGIWKPRHTWFEIQFTLGQVQPEPSDILNNFVKWSVTHDRYVTIDIRWKWPNIWQESYFSSSCHIMLVTGRGLAWQLDEPRKLWEPEEKLGNHHTYPINPSVTC